MNIEKKIKELTAKQNWSELRYLKLEIESKFNQALKPVPAKRADLGFVPDKKLLKTAMELSSKKADQPLLHNLMYRDDHLWVTDGYGMVGIKTGPAYDRSCTLGGVPKHSGLRDKARFDSWFKPEFALIPDCNKIIPKKFDDTIKLDEASIRQIAKRLDEYAAAFKATNDKDQCQLPMCFLTFNKDNVILRIRPTDAMIKNPIYWENKAADLVIERLNKQSEWQSPVRLCFDIFKLKTIFDVMSQGFRDFNIGINSEVNPIKFWPEIEDGFPVLGMLMPIKP